MVMSKQAKNDGNHTASDNDGDGSNDGSVIRVMTMIAIAMVVIGFGGVLSIIQSMSDRTCIGDHCVGSNGGISTVCNSIGSVYSGN